MSDTDSPNIASVEAAVEKPVDASQLPPEEGLKGWLCILGAGICIFCTFGFLNAIGVFQTVYQETYLRDYSPSSISWIFAVQLALMWGAGPVYGRIIDTYGPAPVLYPCAVLCVFALCMTSLAEEYYQIFLAQGLAFGIGSGGVFTAGIVACGQWFVRRRGLGMGIATSGSGLGGVIFPIFINKLIEDVGFPTAIRYTALFIGILLALSCFLVQGRLPHKKWNPNVKWFDLALFKQKKFACFTAGAFFFNWGLWAPFDYLPSMALNSGFSPTLAIYLISIINVTSIPGRVIPPHFADRAGHFNIILACALVSGITILALWLPFNYHPSHAGIVVFALVYGFFSGGFVSLMSICVFKLGGLDTLGQRFGNFQIVVGLASLTGLPIMGAILKRQNDTDFSGLQMFAGVSCLLGTSLIAMSTYSVHQERNAPKA